MCPQMTEDIFFFTGNAEGLGEKYVNQEIVEVGLHVLYN